MDRRPITPQGCLISNIRSLSYFLAFGLIGLLIGEAIAGEEGRRWGFIIAGSAALFLPWRRWLRNWMGRGGPRQ